MAATYPVGHSTDLADYLPGLLERAGLSRVTVRRFHRSPSFKGQSVSDEARTITHSARDKHKAQGFGFWESVLHSSISASIETREGLVKGALHHNYDNGDTESLTLSTFSSALRSEKYFRLEPRELVVLLSYCDRESDPLEFQLPILDMGMKKGPNSVDVCASAISELGLNGMLFDSGSSYHFFSDRLVKKDEFTQILAKAQLLAPIVDSRWVSHQLINGYASLRISTDTERNPTPSRLVAEI